MNTVSQKRRFLTHLCHCLLIFGPGGTDEDLVAPSFKMGFMWETWRRNPYTEPTYCSGAGGHAYDSVNVMSISFGTSGAHNAQ